MARDADNHINCLDGLRGLAALWVVIGHSMLLSGFRIPLISRPELAVDLFILLSGFLMTFHYHLREQIEPWDRLSTWYRFWVRRYFRIAPLYYAVLAIALLTGPLIGHFRAEIVQLVPDTYTPPVRYFDQSLENVLTHVSFVFGQINHFSFRTSLPDWSIGLEMSFYAVFPLLMLVGKRFGLDLTAVIVSLASLALIASVHTFADEFEQPSFLPLKIQLFFSGMLIAEARERSVKRGLSMVAIAVLLSLLPIRCGLLDLIGRPCLVASIAFLVLGRRVEITRRVATSVDNILGLRCFKILGDLSYGAYLVHLPILILFIALTLHFHLGTVSRFLIGGSLTLLTTYGVSALAHKFIEQPGIKLGRGAVRRLREPEEQTQTDIEIRQLR